MHDEIIGVHDEKSKPQTPFCSEMKLDLISVDNGIHMVVGIGL
jgi:hypothetical protein